MAGDKHLQEKGITKIICPAAGSASMTQWSEGRTARRTSPSSASPPTTASRPAMVVEEAINRKFTKVAIFYDSTNYGVSGRDDLLNQIKKQGNKLEVVAQEKFNIGDKDMTAQLLRGQVRRRPGHPHLGHRARAGRRRQRHGQDRL